MKNLKGYMLGLVVGGLVLSGGWFAWGAIQSEVGLNVFSNQTNTWIKQRNIPQSPAVGTSLLDATTGVQSLNAPVVASVLYGTSGGAWIPVGIQNMTSGTFLGVNAALRGVSNIAVFDRDNVGSAANMGVASGGTLSSTAAISLAPTFTSHVLDTRSIPHEYNGTNINLVRNNFNQATTGITTNAAGTAVNMTTTPMRTYTMIIDRTVGATDVVDIALQCSHDGTIWPGATFNTLSVTTLAGEPTRTSVGVIPCNFMRYNVVTVGAGNTLTIQLLATR